MLIKNLSGVFSGEGFLTKAGRHPQASDVGLHPGSIDILIDDLSGRILKIGKGLLESNEGRVLDASGLFATAGFIDTHTHALYAGTRAREYFFRWAGKSYKEISDAGGGIHNTVQATNQSKAADLLDLLCSRLKKILCSGTTTLEIKTGYGGNAESELKHLRFLKELRAFSKHPECFISFLGLHALPKNISEAQYVDDMISVLDNIANEKLAHFVDAFPELGFFSLEQSVRYVKAAKAKGLQAKIHTDELSDMQAAKTFIEMGALSIDHLQKINSEARTLLTKSKTVATLLPATSFFLNLEYVQARSLINDGARVALATDFNPGTAPRYDMQFTNLLAASQLKMSAAEILCATTHNAAAALGLEHERGSLTGGMRADILLWKNATKNPDEVLEEIFVETLKPSAVIANGMLVHSDFSAGPI